MLSKLILISVDSYTPGSGMTAVVFRFFGLLSFDAYICGWVDRGKWGQLRRGLGFMSSVVCLFSFNYFVLNLCFLFVACFLLKTNITLSCSLWMLYFTQKCFPCLCFNQKPIECSLSCFGQQRPTIFHYRIRWNGESGKSFLGDPSSLAMQKKDILVSNC